MTRPSAYRAAFAVVLFGTLLSPLRGAPTGAPTGPCDGVDTSLTADRQETYAQRVAEVVGKGVAPGQVQIYKYMESAGWSAVYASTPETDPGVLFFASGEFKDVWGGDASPSDRDELTEWAKEIGAPEALATCFAHTIAG